MRERPLHPDLAARWGNLPAVRYQGNNEWSAACPRCGDSGHIGSDEPDRFRMWAPEAGKNGRGWCRSCGFFEWADAGETAGTPSPEALAAAQAERERLALENRERVRQKIEAIEKSAYWRGYHDAMTAEQRRIWNGRGVCDYLVDYYSLGYRTDYTLAWNGQEYVTPALTIPHYGPGWRLTNVQYRLQQPPPGAGKYRQTASLPAAMFRTEPEEPLTGAVLIVEGAIKSIVLYQHLGVAPLGFPLAIVGIPSKMPSGSMIAELAGAEPVYLLLDPDAYADGSAGRVATKLGRERVRIAKTPVKPDDLITMYGGEASDLINFLKTAARA